MNKKKLIFINVTFVFFFFCFSLSVFGFGVQPLSVNLEMKPGEAIEFDLTLLGLERQQVVNIDIYESRQMLNGALSYISSDESDYSPLDWITIQNRALIPPRQNLWVPVRIEVPLDAEGSHMIVVMFQEEDPAFETGIQVLVRYAVKININIPQPWLRERMEIIEFNFGPDNRSKPQLMAHIKNTSELAYGVYGEVTIRDESNRLVERVVLRTAVGKQGTIVYPKSEVQFKEVITAPLFPGDYDLRLFMRYADGKQASQRIQISVEDEYLTPETLRYLNISSELISANLRAGGADTSIIELFNQTGEVVNYQVELLDKFPGYERSIFTELDFQIRQSGRDLIPSRGSDRLMTMIRAPREGSEGGYYGILEIKVLSQNGDYLETHLVELEAIVGTEKQTTLEFRDLSVFPDPDGSIMSLSVRNTGNIAFAPRATAYIYSENGEIIRTVTLTLSEDINRILPAFSGFLVGDFENIYEGIYEVMVKAELAGDTLAESQFIVEIEENGGDL